MNPSRIDLLLSDGNGASRVKAKGGCGKKITEVSLRLFMPDACHTSVTARIAANEVSSDLKAKRQRQQSERHAHLECFAKKMSNKKAVTMNDF